jgi:hypothetical protein
MGVQKALARVFKDEDYMKTHVKSVLRTQLMKQLENLPAEYASVNVNKVTLGHVAALAPILSAYLRKGSLEPQLAHGENGHQKKQHRCSPSPASLSSRPCQSPLRWKCWYVVPYGGDCIVG